MHNWLVDPTNKDLVMQGGSPVLVDGVKKIEQDLRWFIVPSKGSDEYHPNVGTTIGSMIGSSMTTDSMQGVVEMQVIDAIRYYHNIILGEIEKERYRFDEMHFKNIMSNYLTEMIKDIKSIEVHPLRGDYRVLEYNVSIITEGGSVIQNNGVVNG